MHQHSVHATHASMYIEGEVMIPLSFSLAVPYFSNQYADRKTNHEIS